MKSILLVLSAAFALAGCEEIVLTPGETDVVVEEGASPVVAFAAQELRDHLTKAFGTPVEVVSEPRVGHRAIYLGDSAASRRAGIDISALKRDAFVIKVTGSAVYIAGKDDPKEDPAAQVKKGATLGQIYERATLFGVYEFLERAVGCRFYFPGELGTVVPETKTLTVPCGETVVTPVFRLRRVYSGGNRAGSYDGTWYDPNEKGPQGKALNWLRQRFESETIPCCHGLNEFGYLHRFAKTHPEYFALLSNGTRSNDIGMPHPGQLCLTSGIYEEVFRDALSYLKGEPASIRGVKNFAGEPGWGANCKWGKYVDVMCQDGMQQCHCKKCQAAYDRRPECEGNWANTLVWSNTCALARRLTAAGVDARVTQMAYSPYGKVPDMEMPSNIDVMVAATGPWSILNQTLLKRDNDKIRAWAEKLGHPVWIWTYPGKYPGQTFPDIPQMTPKAVGDYYRMVRPWIFGTFMESESDRFLYNYLNYYILSRVCWDENVDVEAVLDEHYRLMFGPAADEMKSFYESLEQKWLNGVVGNTVATVLGPTVVKPTQTKLWGEIYSTVVVDGYRQLFARAEEKVPSDSLYARRLALIRREFLDPLAAGSGKFAAHAAKVSALRWKVSDRPENALVISHSWIPGECKAPAETVKSRVTMKDEPDVLTIVVDCDEPRLNDAVAAKRVRDDEEAWKDNGVEIFLNPSDDQVTYYHFMVNSNGCLTDSKCVKAGTGYAKADYKWNMSGKVVVTTRTGGWVLTLTVPKSDLGEIKRRFRAEFLRSRAVKGAPTSYFKWSPYSDAPDEIENMGTLVF